MKKICAGIVTYQPDLERLRENIAAIHPQVDGLVIVDNGSADLAGIRALCGEFGAVAVIANPENQGIAKALNQIFGWAEEQGADWVLTLDQDSVADAQLIPAYRSWPVTPQVGILTCGIRDRNLGEELDRAADCPTEEVRKCITSGSLTRMEAYRKSGGFDEKLFIDGVDDDFCYAVAEQGYTILRINRPLLLHELGHCEEHLVLGVRLAVFNHSPLRKYYITRNDVYLIHKHKLDPVRGYFVVYRRFLTVLLFEKQKGEKFRAMAKGLRDAKTLCREIGSKK